MTPGVVIRLALEERPRVVVDALDENEFLRLLDWLGAHPAAVRSGRARP